jgi:hypothetical protein
MYVNFFVNLSQLNSPKLLYVVRIYIRSFFRNSVEYTKNAIDTYLPYYLVFSQLLCTYFFFILKTPKPTHVVMTNVLPSNALKKMLVTRVIYGAFIIKQRTLYKSV